MFASLTRVATIGPVDYFVGRYALIAPIGNGGMGSVWQAWDARDRRYVAAKLLRVADAGSVLRFVREQSLRVAHPHVVAPCSWAADDDKVLLSMDLVRGGSVEQLLGDHGPLPLPYIAVLVEQLLEALAAIHARGIVHRDVKPSNLLLEPTGRGEPFLRLADFGIAAVVGEPRLTSTHFVVGSPGYVAPECRLDADPDPQQDLYSVGVVTVQLLTGEVPKRGSGAGPSTPLRPDSLPEPVWLVVRSLLADSPAHRPASAVAALEAWREALRSAAVPAIATDHPDAVEVFDQIGALPDGFGVDGPVHPGLRRRRPALLGLLLVVLSGVAGALILALSLMSLRR
jgi:eukaryotic-like serine/threonine-protein kinase